MRWEKAMEVFREGRFAVLDRGVPDSKREQEAGRPRYAVIEYDELGPIMRAGPFHVLRLAVEACQALSFKAELEEPDHAASRR